ncbi:hypothetical protein BXZ70DRAFT_943238 [Cristinia sonorae]|uniref:Uncharacterized protein n=1 Tax=Cristinia sonorae TaxID=1940300 RepID=A0A8K0UM92_9AGAR|nr:hypothetical protein BXZ70DRAFT_943238 [Cristinia sonorae]
MALGSLRPRPPPLLRLPRPLSVPSSSPPARLGRRPPHIPPHIKTLLAHSSSPSRPPMAKRQRPPVPSSSTHPARNIHPAGPSTALLAVLATISASSATVDGHPLDQQPPPPDFLCPLLSPDCHPDSPRQLSPLSPSTPRSVRREASPSSRVKKRDFPRPFVPPKYEQGDDGRWRKSNSWSLYGSQLCGNSQCSPEITGIPVVDNQIQPSQTAATNISPTIDADMNSVLPPGWPAKKSEDHIATAVIVVLSLVLAIIICIFMVGCIAWRKKRRIHAEQLLRDLEKKERAAASGEDSEDDESEHVKLARSRQRMWSKAAARWRANVRFSARRRRAQRSVATRDATPTHTAAASVTSLHSVSSSTAVSLRQVTPAPDEGSPSISPYPEEPRSTTTPSRSSSPTPAGTLPTSHPPAYRTHSLSAGQAGPSDHTCTPHSTPPPVDNDDQPSYLPSDVAHVATDDKGILARMVTLASAPPTESSAHSDPPGTSGGIYPSVPVLEEYEDMEVDSLQSQSRPEDGHTETLMVQPPVPSYSHDPPSSPFPLPPPKSRLAEPLFYEYPSAFEDDVIGTEPSIGPSAPPFEVVAPAPSAPPLDLEDEIYSSDDHPVPSAPPVGEDVDVVSPSTENPSEAISSPNSPHITESDTPSGLLTPPSSTPPRPRSPPEAASGRSPPGYLP